MKNWQYAYLGICSLGMLIVGYMMISMMNNIKEARDDGYISLQDGDTLTLSSGGEVRMLSEYGETSCLVHEDGEQVCTTEFMGKYYTTTGQVKPGVYVLKGEFTQLYFTGVSIPQDPVMAKRGLIVLVVVELLYLLVMLLAYRRMR